MLELPGLKTTGDSRKDLDAVRRYLARLVPQLEMELQQAQQDGYQDAYTTLAKSLGTVNTGTTAGALAEHVLRQDNPHKVTLQQLGFSLDNFVTIRTKNSAWIIRIGSDQRGLMVEILDKTVELSRWHQLGGVCYTDPNPDLGPWPEKIPLPLWVGVTMRRGMFEDYWSGPMYAWTSEQIGTLRIYHECDVDTTESGDNDRQRVIERTVAMTVIGVGVYGYAE
jgi:hypothetical protein